MDLIDYFETQKQDMVDLLTELIGYESFTTEVDMVNKLGHFLEKQFLELQASSVKRMEQTECGDFLLAKWNEDAPGKPIMFLIHTDTVWPSGTLAQRPVTIDKDGRLFGPGAVDMKGGITIALYAIHGLIQLDEFPNRPIWVLMTTDEEVGSKYSASIIKEIAAQAGLVLVMEPGTKDGALKTWRKGLMQFQVELIGKASHAGNAPEQGVNSIIEFAQQALQINQLNDLRNGTSVSVTMVNGGSAGNVIPARTVAHVDTRMSTVKAMNRIDEMMSALSPFIPGSKVLVHKLHARPPMEHNALMRATFGQVHDIGDRIGLTVREDGSGGGSDGNFTAAMGIPTLDGMGAVGDGLHAEHEHVIVNELPKRATLSAAILRDWIFK